MTMKLLWAVLVEFPPLSNVLHHPIAATCGWLYASAKALMRLNPDIELGVAVYSYNKEYKECNIDNIKYYLIPSSKIEKTDKRQISACKKAIENFQPDIIHIHGTEHSLALAMCQANTKQVKCIATIQGLASGIVPYADGGLSLKEKLFNISILDLYRGTFIATARKKMEMRASCELKVIKSIKHIIGRTQWDHDHSLSINPNICYHFINETLRDTFYENDIWSLDKCRRRSIFVSNSGSPLKGAHQVLRALPIILNQFPDTYVNFCGCKAMNTDFRSFIKLQGYHLYLRKLVKKLHLENNVSFLGTLNEQEMKKTYLDANVYVLPSDIENSSNSLCEAQILGVPTVASYCGGTPSLVRDGYTGYLYRYEEYTMLAQIIIRLFKSNDLSQLSENERTIAKVRHDKKKNALELLKLYEEILYY